MPTLDSARDQAEVERACEQAADDLLAAGHDLPSVYLLLGGRLRCLAARGYFQVVDGFPVGTGVIGRVVATGRAEMVDADTDPTFIAAVPPLRSELCVPVLLDGAAVGAVNVGSRQSLDPGLLPGLQEVAAGLGRRLAGLGGLPRPSPSQQLARLAVGLTEATDADAVCAQVVRAAVELSGISTAALVALGDAPVVQAAVGPLAGRLSSWGPQEVGVAAGWVRAGTCTHFPGGEAVPPGYAFLADAGIASLSVQPLVAGGELRGLLVSASEDRVRLAPEVVEALELLAVQAAASLALVAARAELAAERDEAQRRAALLETVLETVDVGVVACDAQGRLTLFNRATRSFYGGADADGSLEPDAIASAYDLRHADGVTPLQPHEVPLMRVLAGEEVREEAFVIAVPGSAPRTVCCDGSPLLGPDDATVGAVVTMRDVTAARQAEADLAASEHLFRATFVVGPTPSLRLDDDGVVQAANAALRRLLGVPSRLVVGRPLSALVHPEDRAALAAALSGQGTGLRPAELRLLALHGGTVWCEVATTRTTGRTGEPHVLVQLVDVSARTHREQELEQAARRDPLTGLGNRSALDAILARAARDRAPVGLLFVDLDGFKAVNDRHGHEAGDAVLVEVALRLRAAVRGVDTVVRLGGDEFVVVCPQLVSEDEGRLLAERLERLLSAPVDADGQRLAVGASVGCAVQPHDEPATLLAAADRAMYARKTVRGRRSQEPSAREVTGRRHDRGLAALVAGAVQEGRVRLDYQPVVRAATGEVVGAEALLRMTDRAGRSLAPDAVVPVAEAEGSIGALGAWVLREALRQAGVWKRALPPGQEFGIGVNLSALQLHEPGLVDLVAGALADSGTDPGALVLEVTETRLVPDTLEVREALTALRGLGVHLAVDDFGAGYASPRYLADFPFDVLKVDRRWTRRLSGTGAAGRLATGVFRLAESTGLVTIAEGVEDDVERDAVLAAGVALAQGYRWSRPVPAEAFGAALLPGLLAVPA